MSENTIMKIEKMIYLIRGQKVMLDSDLAELYQVETKRINEAVKRNMDRFPEDFMFQLTDDESEIQRSQFATFKRSISLRKYRPYVFTELGVAMLSSVLSSPRAVQVNISIMRTFVKLRSFLVLDTALSEKVSNLEKGTNQLFKVVFERLDVLEEGLPTYPKERKRIGIKNR